MSCPGPMVGAGFSDTDIEHAARNGRLLSIEIELSLRYNYRCQYCYVGQKDEASTELSLDEIYDVILQAKELGARKIIILGGEPMIYPRIMETLTFVRDQGLKSEIFTNGTSITEEIAVRLYDLGVQVVLKLNSLDEKIQTELAGVKGAHRTIQDAFRNLRTAGFPAEGHMLAVSTIICTPNLPEITQMWRWLRDQQITPYFEIMTPHGNATKNSHLEVDTATLHKVFSELAEIDRTRYGYEWDPQPPLVGGRCLRHQYSCLVNAHGSILPCVGVTLPLGNVRERRLADILGDSEVLQDLRRHVETIHGPCAACEKSATCYGCRGAAYQLTGDYLASDPICWRNIGRREEIMTFPAEIDGLIPQQASMRVVDRLVSMGERVAVVEAKVPADSLFAEEDGMLDEAFHLELIAQAAAAMNGFRMQRQSSGGRKGYLVGVRALEIFGRARVGDTLDIRVFKAAGYGNLGIIEGQVFRNNDLLSRGEIKVWHDRGAAVDGNAETGGPLA